MTANDPLGEQAGCTLWLVGAKSADGPGAASRDDVSGAIERWLAQAIITTEQAAQMRADLSEPPHGAQGPTASHAGTPTPRPSRPALVTEALGYLGGVIIVVALGLVVGNLWDQMSVGVRLALVGLVTVLLLVAGTMIPAGLGATGVRLRSVLWLASCAALAALLGLAASAWAGGMHNGVTAVVALGTALYSAVLWWAHRYPLQHVAVFVALLVSLESGVSLLPHAGELPGFGVWGLGAAWLALAWGGSIPGRQVGTLLGAVGMIVGVVPLLDQGWGVVLALATVSALVGLALALRDLYLLGVGAIGTLTVLPSIMGRYFPGALAPALALLCLGVLLVAAAVVTTRRRAHGGSEEPRWATGSRRSGMLIAAAIVAATSAVIVAAGID